MALWLRIRHHNGLILLLILLLVMLLLLDVTIQETPVEVIANCIVYVPFLGLDLAPLLVAEDHIIIPALADLHKYTSTVIVSQDQRRCKTAVYD